MLELLTLLPPVVHHPAWVIYPHYPFAVPTLSALNRRYADFLRRVRRQAGCSASGVRTIRNSTQPKISAITVYTPIEKPDDHRIDHSPLLICSDWRSRASASGPRITPMIAGTTGRP